MSYTKGVHFTDGEFQKQFRKAKESDFELGMTYYRKERYFTLYFGKPIFLGNKLVEAAVQFGNDVSAGVAYVKIEQPESTPTIELPTKKEIVTSAKDKKAENIKD